MSALPVSPVPGPEAVWSLLCPRCRAPLGAAGARPLTCASCGAAWPCRDGVLRLLPPERERFYAPFLADYTRIRHAEGRGAEEAAYYLRLPEVEVTNPLAGQWRIRATSYRALVRHVLGSSRGRRVLDLGAGTGWLCHRLALLSHHPCAVDLTVDERDGLAAARHYESDAPAWPRLQAEFDALPLADGQADLVVFNASFHYATDYTATLREALRVLAPGGRITILDSPVYRRDESGRRMVEEKHAAFARRYGTRSDALPSREYLTWSLLEELAGSLSLSWRAHVPWYGLRWAARPLVARLRGRREPSRFALLVFERRGTR